jgi:hypothetical protein
MFSHPILFYYYALFFILFLITKGFFIHFASSDVGLLAIFIFQPLASCQPNIFLLPGSPIARSLVYYSTSPVSVTQLKFFLPKSFLTRMKTIDFNKHKTNVAFRQSVRTVGRGKRTPTQEQLDFLLRRSQVWGISEGMMKERKEKGLFL